MELFTKAKVVKLRSHLEKYLVADDDQETVRQSRNSSGKAARWFVETVQDKPFVICLKSCHGKYLTASDIPFLLGTAGKMVLQTVPGKTDWKLQWKPIREGLKIKLKTWCGRLLRANGGTPPWRNSITHDEPPSGATKKWVLWDVEVVQVGEYSESLSFSSVFREYLLSVSDEVLEVSRDDSLLSSPPSPVSVMSSLKSPRFTVVSTGSPKLSTKLQVNSNKYGSGMDLFLDVKVLRLRSYHGKYLFAKEDEESVSQDRNGSSKNAQWTIEFAPGTHNTIRLKSCYNKYLTASNQPFLLGITGGKVIQTPTRRPDSTVEWEPIREGCRIKLKTQCGNFLRANGGLPPWRNSVKHDIPHRNGTQDWILWDVDTVESRFETPWSGHLPSFPPAIPLVDSLSFESTSPSSVSSNSAHFLSKESSDCYLDSPPKSKGRTISYLVADDSGEVDDKALKGYCFSFRGSAVDELTHKLKEEAGLEDAVVCGRSPLNGKLFPLRLQLPPNNMDMHVVLVPLASKHETSPLRLL
ncbi:hypothetical protein like AT1G27100 [Hibiscus trionum]|uniref:DUF569 domain-containing protein n=1 Tax=Hibiscus trionum TaxID=183268 RepID=A0A9W7H4Y1_HIBTR|nr:hypothetical protein like AT1G27100 [Hibiscus trionum]